MIGARRDPMSADMSSVGRPLLVSWLCFAQQPQVLVAIVLPPNHGAMSTDMRSPWLRSWGGAAAPDIRLGGRRVSDGCRTD